MMLNSSDDMLCLVAEVATRRTAMVIGKLQKALGGLPMEAFVPNVVMTGIGTALALHKRYEHGDYRHDDRELAQIDHLCNWLIEVAQRMGGHPMRPLKIDYLNMRALQPCPPGTYAVALAKVHSEW